MPEDLVEKYPVVGHKASKALAYHPFPRIATLLAVGLMLLTVLSSSLYLPPNAKQLSWLLESARAVFC